MSSAAPRVTGWVGPAWERLRRRRSLASRVTLLTTMAVGIAVTVVAFAAYATVRTQTLSALDDSLRERASRAASGQALDALASQRIPSWALGAADVSIIFVDLDSFRVATSADDTSSLRIGRPELLVANGSQDYSARTVSTADHKRYRMVAVHTGGLTGDREALVLAQSLDPTDETLDRLGLVMLLFGLAGVIAAGFAGWGVASNGLRPVRRLTHAAEDIARTERLEPIPVTGNDEITRLSVAFNAMLTALSASQTRQRQLVADAGHELRTPLTSLRTNLDLLAQSESRPGQDGADGLPGLSPESRRELLEDVGAQIAEMTTLVGDLVELARDEPATGQVEPVELAAVVAQAVRRVRRRAPSLTFDVHTDPWWVLGESPALERAVTNLLDNAAKWSPEAGTVTVRLAGGVLMVGDEGPGIAEADRPHVFDRFYRSTESRGMSGSGLGLSIVRSVAERHGGEVSAGTGPGGGAGLRFSVPGTAQPPEAQPAEVLARS